jgi:hypothetical protein
MRLNPAWLAGVLAFGVISASAGACSGDNEAVQAADAPIGIETDQLSIDIENRTTGPLLEVRISVQTAGAPYTNYIPRLESREKKEFPLNSFMSRDGTNLNLRVTKPRAVQVTAIDLLKKQYDVKAPWK